MLSNYSVKDAQREASRIQHFLPVAELRQMCGDSRANTRLLALLVMRRQIQERGATLEYLELARILIEDESNDCRWQAMIVIGEFIPSHPDTVWEVVAKHGVSDDQDMQMAVATVLLEHLIDHFPAEFRRRADELAAQSNRFAETLRNAWSFESANDESSPRPIP